MALKKSDLYSSLWASCDQLRGGMDASQYKDYILTLLFVKYVSDKAKAHPDSLIDVPRGGSFDDMLAVKGDPEIGDRFNKIIGKLAEANGLRNVIDLADFNDQEKLGRGKEMQDRLSKLVAIFNDLDFRGSRAEGDDLLGDAYEYLMRHFATESGKSKGQFYTPAEVSRVLAKVVGIGKHTRQDQTVYDPACGWGIRYRLKVIERPGRAHFELDGDRLLLYTPQGTSAEQRRTLLDHWYRQHLREAIPEVIAKWEARLDVSVPKWSIRRMKTKWGSCNRETRHIWFNVELAKKHPDSLEYIAVHEMTHYLERNHGERFTKLMDGFLPDWRNRRDNLNTAPLAQEEWA